MDGEVRYVHNEEIGRDPVVDSFMVMVSDRHPDAGSFECGVVFVCTLELLLLRNLFVYNFS